MEYENKNFISFNIWFSGESRVLLWGFINKKATRYLGFQKPQIFVEIIPKE